MHTKFIGLVDGQMLIRFSTSRTYCCTERGRSHLVAYCWRLLQADARLWQRMLAARQKLLATATRNSFATLIRQRR